MLYIHYVYAVFMFKPVLNRDIRYIAHRFDDNFDPNIADTNRRRVYRPTKSLRSSKREQSLHIADSFLFPDTLGT